MAAVLESLKKHIHIYCGIKYVIWADIERVFKENEGMINCKLMVNGTCKNCNTECSKLKSYKQGFQDAMKPIDKLYNEWLNEKINDQNFIDEVGSYVGIMKREEEIDEGYQD